MTSHRRSPLVLIVDDDTTTNQMIQTILTWAGFQTACAFDVAGALAGIREQHPDLILLDVSLPDGSGFEVCRRIQEEPGASQTPVLFISSNEDVSTKVQGFEAGGVDYITKAPGRSGGHRSGKDPSAAQAGLRDARGACRRNGSSGWPRRKRHSCRSPGISRRPVFMSPSIRCSRREETSTMWFPSAIRSWIIWWRMPAGMISPPLSGRRR